VQGASFAPVVVGTSLEATQCGTVSSVRVRTFTLPEITLYRFLSPVALGGLRDSAHLWRARGLPCERSGALSTLRFALPRQACVRAQSPTRV